jgi:hypothetical protein
MYGTNEFTIACILSALSALCILACGFVVTSSDKILILVAKALPLVTLVAGIIGVAVGISAVSTGGPGSLGVAAILGIIAVIINLAGGIVAILIQT